MLTEVDITKFQLLYLEQFGVEISREKAVEQGLKLLTLMSVVYRPITKEEARRVDARRFDTKQELISRVADGRSV